MQFDPTIFCSNNNKEDFIKEYTDMEPELLRKGEGQIIYEQVLPLVCIIPALPLPFSVPPSPVPLHRHGPLPWPPSTLYTPPTCSIRI